jgi:transcriptional regulator GlxA family with amidase domain
MRQVSSRGIQAGRDVVDVGAETADWDGGVSVRLRIEKAQSLMKDQSLRMIDIAESCGFASLSQFSRVFKQVVGVSPKQYRP